MSKVDLTQLHCYLQILGLSVFSYDIVIGGNGNRVAILRCGSPRILGEKQYVFEGLYKTSISVLVPEIGHWFSSMFLFYYAQNIFGL
jgi:hypothetical protein